MTIQSRYLLKKMSDNQLRWMFESTAHLSRKKPRWNCQTCCWKNWRSVLPKSRQHLRERLLKSLGNDRVSAEMATEEGDEVKEDEEVEANVVEGADSPLDVDEAVPCGSLLKRGKFGM